MKRISVLLWLAATIFIVTACGGSGDSQSSEGETTSESRTIEHAMGETEISGTPKRIVALEFSYVDALASLGITPVGIADDGDPSRVIPQIRSEIGDWTSVGTRAEPNLEKIAALNPDLIIADSARHQEIYDQLSQIAPTIVLSSYEGGYDETLDSFRVIGKALNREQEMQQRIAEHKEKMNSLASEVPADEKRQVLAAVASEDYFSVHTPETYTPEVLAKIGLPYAMEGKNEEAYLKVSLEQLTEINPDVMFLMTSGEETVVDEWKDNGVWQNLKAVENGQVYEVDRNLWSRSRGIISAEAIAEDALKLLYEK